MDINERRNLLITCGPSLAEYVQKELETLGYKILNVHRGGITIKGSLKDCMKLNLQLRCAYNILYLLKEFGCGSADSLYKQVKKLPWEKIIPNNEYFTVISHVDTWSIDNSMYPSLKVKDAIVDRIGEKTGSRPNSGPDRAKAVVNLFWKHERAWIYINTSGIKISDRGYRKQPGKAPLRECLASAILMATGYDGSQDIVLPMCGSGTLAIEAALIATGRAPGSLRPDFGFKHISCFDEKQYEQIRREITTRSPMHRPLSRIIATDISREVIEAAKANAVTAGVEGQIEFGECDFSETPLPEGGGIVLMNPEYGQRLGVESELERLYKRMGDFYKQSCTGFTGYIFTGNLQLAKRVGLKTSRRHIFYNGNIECRLLEYQLYEGTKKSH